MPKSVVLKKEWNGKTYYTSTYLVQNELFLSSSTARSLLQNYEYEKELGSNPKYYSEDIIQGIIKEYENDESKWTAVQQRKKKAEELRAARERELYDKATAMTADEFADWHLVQKRIEKDLAPTMLKNLFAALGHEFDMETFYRDVEKVESYKRSAVNYGLPRPQEVVEAEDRLLSNNGYLK